MESKPLLPKRLVSYIREIGVRALDHLAETVEEPQPADAAGIEPAPNAIATLVGHWNSMAGDDKEQFVEQVAAAVVEVVAASTMLPVGLKLEKKAEKATRKAIRKQAKKLRKVAKAAIAEGPKKKKKKRK